MHREGLVASVLFCSIFFTPLFSEVKNRDRPAKGDWDLNPVKVWQVDRAGEDVFGYPFTVRASEDERIYIYDSKIGVNTILDSQGNLVRRFAGSGQGPGEVIGQGHTLPIFHRSGEGWARAENKHSIWS